ncbi:MAG: acyl-CoA desaturase [Bdellovibrionales bacterium]|nr:acyl-CoA desaturase [Bdellovibrionales bacterium]
MKYVKPFLYDSSVSAEFQEKLKQRVQDHFQIHRMTTHGGPMMFVKSALFVATYWWIWSQIALKPHSFWVSFALLIGLALTTILVAFNVSHDAVHGSLTPSRRLNSWIFNLTFNPLGPNAYLWKIRHLNAHHFFVNIPGSDMDIEATKVLRVAPHVRWYPAHRFQHYYFVLAYSLFTMNWIFIKDFQIFRMKTFGGVTDLKHSPWRFVELVAWKVVYVGLMIGIPAAVLPYKLSTVLTAFVLFHMFQSAVLLILFAASHISEKSHYVVQEENGYIPHSFIEHQLLTSVDYAPRSFWMGILFGGFNAHVAHHIFPNTCSTHYPEISRIIKNTALEYGLPYQETTFFGVIASHFRMMKRLGEKPGSCQEFVIRAPEEKAYVTEGATSSAVNHLPNSAFTSEISSEVNL